MLDDATVEAIAGDQFPHLMAIRNRWAIYRNEIAGPLRVQDNTLDPTVVPVNDNLILPTLRTFIVKGRSYLMGRGFQVEIGKQSGGGADEWLDALQRRNMYRQKLLNQATNGAVAGHNFVKFNPDPSNTKSLAHRLTVLDPANVTPLWSADDHEDIWAYRIRLSTVDRATNRPMLHQQDIVRADNGESWEIREYVAKLPADAIDGDGNYVPRKDQRFQWTELAEKQVVWPFPWAPIFHCQNLPAPNQVWGESDIEGGVDALSYGLTRIASNTNRIIRHHAHPKTIAKGVELAEWDNSIDGVTMVPEDADVYNLEMQSDLGATLSFFETLLDLLHEAARVPRIATGKVDGIGNLSSLAMQILYGPLLEATEDKRSTYGPMQEQMFERVLEYAGFDIAGDIVTVQFPNPLPKDEKADAEASEARERAGFSQRTEIERLGGDPETEFANRLEEQALNPDMFGIGDRLDEQAQDMAPDTVSDDTTADTEAAPDN
jgi:hypothetical protein